MDANIRDLAHRSIRDLICKFPEGGQISMWTRMRVILKFEFSGFPKVLAELIAAYCATLKLLDWIPRKKLSDEYLYANPNALLAGILDLDINLMTRDRARELCRNPEAMEWIRANIDQFKQNGVREALWANPNAIDFAKKHGIRCNYAILSQNPNRHAISILLDNRDKIDENSRIDFSTNPGAMPWLREHPEMIDYNSICANPEAIDIIQEMPGDKLRPGWLSYNPHPWAIEYLRRHQDKINWENFSTNPGIFEPLVDQRLVAALTR